MTDTICLNRSYTVLLLFTIVILGMYLYNMDKQNMCICPKQEDINLTIINEEDNSNVDKIKEYDYRKVVDPLESPTMRVDREYLPPVDLKNEINISTRGYPDTFRQVGILINNEAGDNKLLRLFGRKEFPRSNRYEYYTAINSGNDIIKVPLNIKKELYDDDNVIVDELSTEYKVKIYKYDSPRYYPDIF